MCVRQHKKEEVARDTDLREMLVGWHYQHAIMGVGAAPTSLELTKNKMD